MENSTDDLKRARTSRVQLLHEARLGECTESCCGQWLACTKEVLERNKINIQYFARCVLDLLTALPKAGAVLELPSVFYRAAVGVHGHVLPSVYNFFFLVLSVTISKPPRMMFRG